MTAVARFAPPLAHTLLHRTLGLLIAACLFVAGWTLLGTQASLLWQRVPADAADRFVADQITVPLPRLPSAELLREACAEPLSERAAWRPAWLRAELADCLARPAGWVQGRAAEAAVSHYEARIAEQIVAAESWLAAYDHHAPAAREALGAELATLRQQRAPALAWAMSLARLIPASETAPTTRREPVGRAESPDALAQALRQQVAATRAALQRDTALPAPERARELALQATGLQLVTDYGQSPPAVHLNTARQTLADRLEWMRRGSGHARQGFSLTGLAGLPAALMLSSAVLLLCVALASRLRLLPMLAWTVATLLLGFGAVMLTDLALTGDPALRSLAARQFLSFDVGGWTLPLTLALPAGVTLWWPVLAASAGVLGLGLLRDGSGLPLAPLRAWVRCSGEPVWGGLQSLGLLLLACALVLFLGMPAAISELLILLACVGVATYLARQASHASLGAGLQLQGLAIAAMALTLALGGSVARGDLGHALVALLLAACFAWLFGWTWLRWAVLAAAAGLLASLAVCLAAGELVGPLAWLAEHLPPHAQQRFLALFDPLHADASDLARIRWLIASAGAQGWGVGYVPWQGLAPAGAQEGLPLQGPSDYVLALACALWGQVGGLLLLGAVLALFSVAAVAGLRTALRPAMPAAVRLLAATGGFGSLVMAVKVLLSVGGVAGVLPLTGLPVALLGYGPVTHLAALLYLALALGTLHVQPSLQQRGVDLRQRPAPRGAVRRRGLGLAVASAGLLSAALVMAFAHLFGDWPASGLRHVARERLALAQALASAIRPRDSLPAVPAGMPCAELGTAVDAWNSRLARLDRPLRIQGESAPVNALALDPQRLLAGWQVNGERACRGLARTLGQMLDSDFSRLLGPAATPKRASVDMRLAPFDRPHLLLARSLDYSTANAWWGRPGCLLPAARQDRGCPSQDEGSSPLQIGESIALVATDAWLQRELAPQLFVATRAPSGTGVVNHHPVAIGPALGVTLEPETQARAQLLADCFTARRHGTECQAVMPLDAAWRQRYFEAEGSLRAGALGIVIAEVDSGRVVGLAGAVSDCTLQGLARDAEPDASGRMPALRAGSPCAQLPDRRSAWMALQEPALVMVPPGSSVKELSFATAVDARLVAPADDPYWKGILAESHEREPIQRLALSAGQRYLDLLGKAGFARGERELLWGGDGAAVPMHAAWRSTLYAGTAGLQASSMPLAQVEQIRRQKLAGINVDKQWGAAAMQQFLAARAVADASVGGGDIRINSLGLIEIWRQLDLRARGRTEAPALHLLEQDAHSPAAPHALDWLSQEAAARTLQVTSGVSASAWKGTAQGSCRVVFGACPPQGVAGLSGKTGSSDFLLQEDSPFVKPGMQLPAKLFGGVFTAGNGKRYAVAAMALRVREGQSRSLELKPSAAAEAAFTMARLMGLKP